jgi:hypothetical protein
VVRRILAQMQDIFTAKIARMHVQKTYTFNPVNYNSKAIHVYSRKFFTETIGEWESDFHKTFPHCFSNYLFGNMNTMNLIGRCLDLQKNQVVGMELINGCVDLDANLKIEDYSPYQTIYAIDSNLVTENPDEPLFFIIDHEIADGVVILKYIPDDDQDGAFPEPACVNSTRLKLV